MKNLFKTSVLTVLLGLSGTTFAQATSIGQMQNLIPRDQRAINQFDVKKDSNEFKGLSVDLGGAFAIQFQALNCFNDQAGGTYTASNGTAITNYKLNNLENQFNLPTANMTIGAQLYDGVRVNLDLYLAARHHNETWVKGGYLQIDKLDFIQKDFLAGFMKYATIKIGQMENNYGDAHFRRSDNGSALVNPFIESNIMDSFTTEMGAEIYYLRNGFVSMFGLTNGKLNQNVTEFVPAATTATTPDQNTTISPTILAKLGYDKQLNKDLRLRITGSVSHNANMSGNPWSSDRAGSRYYYVMSHAAYTYGTTAITNNATTDLAANPTTGRFNPGFGNWFTTVMVNPFVKYKGLEFFGTLEMAQGGDKKGVDAARKVDQYAGDVVYRFGTNDKFYWGARYNVVSGKLANADLDKVTVTRLESSLGWFMTKNILAKVAYTTQNYKGYSQYVGNSLNDLYGGKFDGLLFESVITF
jgi:hypothetical protein